MGTRSWAALAAVLLAAACSAAPPTMLSKHSSSNASGDDSQDQQDTSETAPSGSSSGSNKSGSSSGGGSSSSSSSSSSGGSSSSSSSSGSAPSCIAAASSPGSGNHHAGADCMSCHQDVSGAVWTISGTLYDGTGAALSGATIEVVDANGKKLDLHTCDNGNFYTTTAVSFPVKVRASQCPTDSKMSAAANDGSCNGCHGSAMPITLQ